MGYWNRGIVAACPILFRHHSSIHLFQHSSPCRLVLRIMDSPPSGGSAHTEYPPYRRACSAATREIPHPSVSYLPTRSRPAPFLRADPHRHPHAIIAQLTPNSPIFLRKEPHFPAISPKRTLVRDTDWARPDGGNDCSASVLRCARSGRAGNCSSCRGSIGSVAGRIRPAVLRAVVYWCVFYFAIIACEAIIPSVQCTHEKTLGTTRNTTVRLCSVAWTDCHTNRRTARAATPDRHARAGVTQSVGEGGIDRKGVARGVSGPATIAPGRQVEPR